MAADEATASDEGAVAKPLQAEAAVAETNGDKKTIDWKPKEGAEEVILELPPKLMGSVVFRAGILRDNDIAGASRLCQAIVGSDQFELILDAMDAANVTTDDEEGMTSLGDLLNKSLALYGLTEGESTASQES